MFCLPFQAEHLRKEGIFWPRLKTTGISCRSTNQTTFLSTCTPKGQSGYIKKARITASFFG